MVPRLVKAFDGPKNVRGVKKVFAGGTYSMAVNEHGKYGLFLKLVTFL